MTGAAITAICPTLWSSRLWCLPLAARALGHQEVHPPLIELLVGVDAEVFTDRTAFDFMVGRLAPRHVCSVRLIPCAVGESLGERRNRLCRAAETDWIAHWDDDDWKGPWNLAAALEVADRTHADIVGSHRAIFYDLDAGAAWRYRSKSSSLLVGTSLVYRRELAMRVPFPAVDRGEDTLFVHDARLQGARVATYAAQVVAFQHGQRTGRNWPPVDPEYEPISTGCVYDLMGDELDRWATAYTDRQRLNARTSKAPAQSLP